MVEVWSDFPGVEIEVEVRIELWIGAEVSVYWYIYCPVYIQSCISER